MNQATDEQYLRRLVLENAPLMDTRAPLEFAQGSFPQACNLPLMDDDERAQVGTCYKQQGQEAALALGHRLVSGERKQQRIQVWLDFAQKHPNGFLFCFRGGLRSQIAQQWLRDAACDYPRIAGGYRAFRQYLLQQIETLSVQQSWIVLSGRTGCAKTTLLQELPRAIDLEGLAQHRGSAFGKRVMAQPMQCAFEHALAYAMIQKNAAMSGSRFILEDESAMIGRIAIPSALFQAMGNAPIVVLEASFEERVAHTFNNYILKNLHDWQALYGESLGFEHFEQQLIQALAGIQRRLGGLRYQHLHEQLQGALCAHQNGNLDAHRIWIASLLREYYDPMYDYQLAKKSHRVIFSGAADAVQQYLLHETKLCP